MKRKRYYDPGANPQPTRPQAGDQAAIVGQVTRQLRRQARKNPELAAFIAEYDRRAQIINNLKTDGVTG